MRIPPATAALIVVATVTPAFGQGRAPVDYDRPEAFVAAVASLDR